MQATPHLTLNLKLNTDDEIEQLAIALRERAAKLEAEYNKYSNTEHFTGLSVYDQELQTRPMNTVRRMVSVLETALKDGVEVKG